MNQATNLEFAQLTLLLEVRRYKIIILVAEMQHRNCKEICQLLAEAEQLPASPWVWWWFCQHISHAPHARAFETWR